MGASKLEIEDFLGKSASMPVLDVRSPGEYAHAHIPGAISFPIFNDEERRIIGTTYKQQSREKAIKIGLDFFGRKMTGMVETIEEIYKKKKFAHREVLVHCWRGGMRSAAIAWLLDLYGFKVHLLQGGYKAYRHWVLSRFELQYPLLIVGGYTGGNKTGVLHVLEQQGHQVVDLEALSDHRGSAFGNLDGSPQPSQEQFENQLASRLALFAGHEAGPIWVEGESQRLGLVNIPIAFFKTMRNAPLLFLDIPFESRLAHIVEGYGRFPKEKLIAATLRIKKRLGGLETSHVINALLEDDIQKAFSILLKYYDRFYLKSTYDKEHGSRRIINVTCEDTDAVKNANIVLNYGEQKHA